MGIKKASPQPEKEMQIVPIIKIWVENNHPVLVETLIEYFAFFMMCMALNYCMIEVFASSMVASLELHQVVLHIQDCSFEFVSFPS